jgi:hypothetical protein
MLRLSAGAAAVAVPITALSVVSGGSSALSPAPIKKLTEADIDALDLTYVPPMSRDQTVRHRSRHAVRP